MLIDWEIASVDFRIEGLLMAPPYAIPRLLQRNSLNHADIHLWEIHEAFAAQVLAHIKALESPEFIRDKARVTASFGAFPRDRMNPNGGSVALGHPLAQRTRDILSQAQLSTMPSGERTIVSICADGGQETGALIDMTGAPVASTRS